MSINVEKSIVLLSTCFAPIISHWAFFRQSLVACVFCVCVESVFCLIKVWEQIYLLIFSLNVPSRAVKGSPTFKWISKWNRNYIKSIFRQQLSCWSFLLLNHYSIRWNDKNIHRKPLWALAECWKLRILWLWSHNELPSIILPNFAILYVYRPFWVLHYKPRTQDYKRTINVWRCQILLKPNWMNHKSLRWQLSM